jgi:hypothetical protein
MEAVGLSDAAISDGLPDGVNINNVSKAVYDEVVGGLAKIGLTKNNNKNRFKVKYNILYLGHKYKGIFHASYIIKYNIQLIDENTGDIIASKKDDKDDKDLRDTIEHVAEDIIYFATTNIK